MTRTTECIDCGGTIQILTVKGRPPGRCEDCKRKYAASRQREWRAKNPERARAIYARNNAKRLADPDHRRLKREAAIFRTYGITPADYAALLDQQGGVCAICGELPKGRANGRARPDLPSSFHVDHNHTTGQVRGLLCSNCNTMLGLAGDDVAVLQNAIQYLTKTQ